MQKLREYFKTGQMDGVWKEAEKLLEFFWFVLCLHFGRRGREGWAAWKEYHQQAYGNNFFEGDLVTMIHQ